MDTTFITTLQRLNVNKHYEYNNLRNRIFM